MRKKILTGLFFLIYFSVIMFAFLADYLAKMDTNYWLDKCNQSQWSLPLSKRTIGDDGIYLCSGILLVGGADPTSHIPQVPPLGKYLIGIVSLVTQNRHLYGLLTTSMLIGAFYFLALYLFKKNKSAFWATALLMSDPLLISQMSLSMLDSLYATSLVLYLILMTFWFKKPQKTILLWTAGAVLGVFSSIKYPILTPVILALSSGFIWFRTKTARHLLIPIITTITVFSGTYFVYFYSHNLSDFLRDQKWIFDIQNQGRIPPNYGSLISLMTTGWVRNIHTFVWEKNQIWSPVWVLLIGAYIYSVARILLRHSQKNISSNFMLMILSLFFLFFNTVPFFSRYTLMVLPVMYILFTSMILSRLKKAAPAVLGAAIVLNSIAALPVLFPTPESFVKQYVYNWENGFFQDMYEDFSPETKRQLHEQGLDREAFFRTGQKFIEGGEIEKIKVTYDSLKWNMFTPSLTINTRVEFTTRSLGRINDRQQLSLVSQNNRYKVNWTWDNLTTGMGLDKNITTTLIPARRGRILDKSAKVVAEDAIGYLIWATPEKIETDKETEMTRILEEISGAKIAAANFHQRIKGNTHPQIAIPLLVTGGHNKLAILEKFPGINITSHFYRRVDSAYISKVGQLENRMYAECCSYLYNTTSYSGVSGWEKTYDNVLKGNNGGIISIIDRNGKVTRTLSQSVPHNGQDVRIR